MVIVEIGLKVEMREKSRLQGFSYKFSNPGAIRL